MKKKIFSILFAFALVLALGLSLATAVPVAAQDTYYVATTGSDAFGDGTETWADNDFSGDWSDGDTGPWLTIQHAIDTVSASVIINVAAGTYNECLNVNKTISIVGTGVPQVTINVSGLAVNNAGIYVSADGVALQGFTVVCSPANTSPRYGIKFGAVSGGSVTEILVRDIYRSGFDFLGTMNTTVSNVESRNNGGHGISLVDCNNITLSNITTSGSGWAAVSVATWGHYSPLGTSGIVFNGTNSFGGIFQLEEGDYNNPGVPPSGEAIITYSTNPADGADVTVQASDFGYALHGDQDDAPDQNRVWFFKTLAEAQAVPPTAPVGHLQASNIFIESLTDRTQLYVSPGCEIQAAIDFAAPGDTINVAAGEYAGAVVDKSVKIVGETDGTSVIISGVPYKEGNDSHNSAFRPEADGIETRNFTINCNAAAGFDLGIYAVEVDEVTVDSLTINSEGTVQGISNWGGSGWVITNNVITNTVASGGGGIGIFLGAKAQQQCSGNLVQYNEVNATATAETYSCPGICLCLDTRYGQYDLLDGSEDVSGNQILDNTIMAAGANNGVGIEVGTILGNSEEDADRTDPVKIADLMEAAALHDNTIQGNAIDGAYEGIYFYNVTDLLITQNEIKDCTNNGVFAEHAHGGVTLLANTFADNKVQVLDDAEALFIEDVLANNFFDRAVVIDREGGSLLHTIWSKIQEAIDAADAGDTINVAAGTYTEAVTITPGSDLTIQGAGRDVTTWIAPADDASRMHCIKCSNANNTTLDISGFTFSVEDNEIDDSGIAILINRADGGLLYLDIHDNKFVETTTILDETANSMLLCHNRFAPRVDGVAPVKIYNNLDYTTGGIAMSNSRAFDIYNNTFDGGSDAIYIGYGCPEDTTIGDHHIYNNTFRNASNAYPEGPWPSIYFDYHGSGTGMTFMPSTIENNTFEDNDVAIGYSMESNITYPADVIQFNNFDNNTEAVRVFGTFATTVNATCNWWGAIDGPSTSPGSGDNVSTNVIYSPWLGQSKDVPHPWIFYVDDAGPEPAAGYIQTAIDAAVAGDTVLVAAGTYNLIAPIAVTESVTLTGDITTPSNVVVDAGTIAGDDRDGFQVKASGVTIQGFKIQGAIDTSGGQNNGVTIGAWWDGDPIVGLQDIVISYNEVTNCSKGISVCRAQHITISYNTIHDCPTGTDKPGSWPGKGIMLYGSGPSDGIQNNDIDILNNEIYNNGLFGIELNHWETTGTAWVDVDVFIDGNIIYNNGGPFDDVGYAVDCGRGISANGWETGVTITNNEIYGHWSTSGARFHHTTAGIRVNDSKGFVISNNNVHDNMRGIYIYGTETVRGGENTGFIVTGNDVYDNAQGIVFGDGDVGYAHFNNIYDNNMTAYTGDGIDPYGVVNLATGTVVFDATNNWWGDASGPTHVASAGTGDAVSDNVDYAPWLRASVEDSKRETVTDDTVDAKTEADTEVVVTGTATVTATKYSSNPGSGFGGDIGKYVDVHIDDPTGVDEIEIRVYYTNAEIGGLVESSLILRWWDGTTWTGCSDTGVNTTDIPGLPPYSGYIWAKIRNDTIPTLAQLSGTAFGGSGGAPPPVVGGGPPGPDRCHLIIDMLGERTMVEIDCCENTTMEECEAYDEEELHLLGLEDDTLVLCGECNGCHCYPRIIVMSPSGETPALPEGMAIVGDIYDFTGYKDARMQLECQLVTYFEPVATVTLHYDPELLPEGAFDPVIGFYSHTEGRWIILLPDTGVVAEVGVATGLADYFASPFAVLVSVPPAATSEPPPPPPAPAHFIASGLSITPAEAKTGETVTISLNVANDGEETGTHTVELKVNGNAVDSEAVTLGGGQSESVSFAVSASEAGTYEVTVSGLSGSFTVEATSIWWIYFIIAGVVVVGLLIFLLVRRRRA